MAVGWGNLHQLAPWEVIFNSWGGRDGWFCLTFGTCVWSICIDVNETEHSAIRLNKSIYKKGKGYLEKREEDWIKWNKIKLSEIEWNTTK